MAQPAHGSPPAAAGDTGRGGKKAGKTASVKKLMMEARRAFRVWAGFLNPAGKPRRRAWCRREINGSWTRRRWVKGWREKGSGWFCAAVLRFTPSACVSEAMRYSVSSCSSLCSWFRDILGVSKKSGRLTTPTTPSCCAQRAPLLARYGIAAKWYRSCSDRFLNALSVIALGQRLALLWGQR